MSTPAESDTGVGLREPRGVATSRRRQSIVAAVTQNGYVAVAALAAQLGVSEMTVRRDLEALESERLLGRVRGGAVTRVPRGNEPPLALRASQDADAKRRIGSAAAELVAEGETAIVDVGTTTLELARALQGRERLTVVTPSILAATELAHEVGITTFVTGGMIRHGELSLVGPETHLAFAQYNCDVAFLGVAGVDVGRGLTEYSPDDAHAKRAMIAAARRVVVLADASKLGNVAFATVAELSEIDTIVSDAPADHPVLRAAARVGVNLVHAPDAR